jgi:hypothetical protein
MRTTSTSSKEEKSESRVNTGAPWRMAVAALALKQPTKKKHGSG